MDRRQRKTREAIFHAFTEILSEKNISKITVGEIIDRADVGRATFYAHFPTKDYLVKELCEELFCHVFDATDSQRTHHRHIFHCNAPESVFLHLFQHLKRNDHHILDLLTGRNNELFSGYFKRSLVSLIESQLPALLPKKAGALPESFWINHLANTFAETVRWWVDHGLAETPEEIHQYFGLAIGPIEE